MLAEYPSSFVRASGEKVLGAVRLHFGVIHRQEALSPGQRQAALERARRGVVPAATQTEHLSPIRSVRQG